MARRGPGDWKLSPRRYRPDQQPGFAFETKKKARAEDRKRARIIGRGTKRLSKRSKKLIKSLASPTSFPPNMTSARYLRTQRRRINGQLTYLIARLKARVELVTLLPSGWLMPAEKLSSVDPPRLIEQLRAVLYRAGIWREKGWAFLVIDIEYIEHLDAYAFHIHGVANGGVARGLSALRHRPKFKARQEAGLGTRPVQLKRVANGSEARALNYLIKTFYPKRVFIDVGGELVRTGRKVALPSQRHAELLVWLKQWKIEDFTLSVRLYHGRDRLEVSEKGAH